MPGNRHLLPTIVPRTLATFALLLMVSAGNAHAQGASRVAQPQKGAPVVPASADTIEPVPPSIDHSRFDALLRANVNKGLVNYSAFRNNPEFTQYLASLNAVNLTKFEEAERIAFWLNVYNAYTIQLVANSGETESIRNIDKTLGLFRLKGPWTAPIVKAAGRVLTLDDVEHRILRKEFSEPRVHFAMSFASLGGPPLRSEAYTGEKLDDQLEDQARVFLRESPTQNSVDTLLNTVYASPILTRYRSDFGESPTALGLFLAHYYPEGAEKQLLRSRPPKARLASIAADSVRRAAIDSALRAADSIKRVNSGGPAVVKADTVTQRRPDPRNQPRQRFQLRETPFNWALNIQQPVKK